MGDAIDPEDEAVRRAVVERRAIVERQRSAIDADERERLRKLHFMRCAKCGMELTEIQFRGVKVDKCFSCGGVYLDDGELEQLAGAAGWFERLVGLLRG